MLEIRKTDDLADWFDSLRDQTTRVRIQARIDRMERGNFGDVAPVGEGVSEARLHCGAGYRLYFVQRGETLVVLLAGGDKHTQANDIQLALELARKL